jgi:hypothetical protein
MAKIIQPRRLGGGGGGAMTGGGDDGEMGGISIVRAT